MPRSTPPIENQKVESWHQYTVCHLGVKMNRNRASGCVLRRRLRARSSSYGVFGGNIYFAAEELLRPSGNASSALGVPAGYALARFRFRGAGAYRVLILMTRAFPVAILALLLTVSFIRLGVYDTPFGVALVHAVLATPFATLVCASLFVGIPKELEEAAWVFGCSRFTGFLRVVLPLALPGIAAASIFAFVLSWNEVFAASVLTVRQRTLTAYLLSVLSESPLHLQFAGGLVLIVPSVLFIFLVRRRLFAMWGIGNR